MNRDDENNERLLQEGLAFDQQIDERIAHGHIPDLRRTKPCDYFYNNSWRRPGYVQLDFYEQFTLIRDAISAGMSRKPQEIRVLEVGCGPGYLSLELARAGFQVTGLDLSERCIQIASKFADEDPWISERGILRYIAGDYYTCDRLDIGSYDVVVFLGALHHFQDQSKVLQRSRDLLKTGGLIVAHEPARDRITRGNAAFAHLLSTILSLNNNFYTEQALLARRSELLDKVENVFSALRYENDSGEKTQSINDNDAGYAEMYPELRSTFEQIRFEWRYSFFHEFIGGLRFDEEKNLQVAEFLKEMDRILVETEVLQGTEFFFVGRKEVKL
ncbi:class I SAM-dependent methyltransferase [Noviherbaspirillum sp. CPCC 100848]|uniref:Class I SAM-dependent methyltransferase n=1 Tax=Noviherbaspirillum album TaxID=3080276 RepID=A0ABU6JD20_9BURK|nr:class I SAM-dependent methyltransferase [Noviherbaspirillum sp. CPCC 100848]MEC4721338.1 class I SAM-dependent methyltransferase [Noviherbaspirillum sp. CPCC 100848]